MSIGDDLNITQSVAFALLHALDREDNPAWVSWAHGWLKGDDRGGTAAEAAAQAAITPAARHAATAARLLDEAQALQTEAEMLSAEGRNVRWTLDNVEQINTRCLIDVAEAMRLSGNDHNRSEELRAEARKAP